MRLRIDLKIPFLRYFPLIQEAQREEEEIAFQLREMKSVRFNSLIV